MPAYKQVKRINIRTEEFAKTTTGKIKRFGNTLITNAADSRGRASFSEIRRAQMKRAKKKAQALADSTDPYVVYKTSRPITDIKQMIETSTDIYGDRVAFYQKYQKDMPYTVITYRQMLADVNGLGTALMNRGLSGANRGDGQEPAISGEAAILRSSAGTALWCRWTRNWPEKELGYLIEAAGGLLRDLSTRYKASSASWWIRRNETPDPDSLWTRISNRDVFSWSN